MFTAPVEKRLKELDKNVVIYSEESICLTEHRTGGEANLTIELHNPCILFKSLEEKKLQYFEIKKCADFVLFEYREDEWYVHVFELKRTISSSNWETMQEQFAGAILNSFALAGALGIMPDYSETRVYSCYRNDKINDAANPAKQRSHMIDIKKRQTERKRADVNWNDDFLLVALKQDKMRCQHQKIKLDAESGNGVFLL